MTSESKLSRLLYRWELGDGKCKLCINFGHKIFALEILCNNIHSYLLYKMSRKESFIILSKIKKKFLTTKTSQIAESCRNYVMFVLQSLEALCSLYKKNQWYSLAAASLIHTQCSKLLSDVSVIQFYPSKFVLITDILDNFGEMGRCTN